MKERDLNIIVKMVSGSHLYGTYSKSSDLDYKGIYLPDLKSIILKQDKDVINFNTNNSKTKNTKDDIDVEYYSLYKFLQLCRKGETVAIDMLHTPFTEASSDIWKFIRENRSKFYTTRISAFLGYCKSQAVKYGEKGNRLSALEEVISVLNQTDFPENDRISTIFKYLPVNEYCKFSKWEDGLWYDVLEKHFKETNTIGYVLSQLNSIYRKYGERTKKAKFNKGVDWKAISHAFRFGYQLKELFETGDIIFPLKNAEFIKSIKYGKLDYIEDEIPKKLDKLINDVKILVDENRFNFPEKSDFKFWEDFYYEVINKGENI